MKDPIVEEVRKYRMEHTRKFKGDLTEICADFQDRQKASGHKVVRLAPRKPDLSNDIMRQRRKLSSEGDKMS